MNRDLATFRSSDHARTPSWLNWIVYATVGAVLSGSIFGDHCSPISDTTIISSTLAGSDHMDHVTTQIPYAFFAAFIAIIGYLVMLLEIVWYVVLPLGFVLLYVGTVVLSNVSGKLYGLSAIVPPFKS